MVTVKSKASQENARPTDPILGKRAEEKSNLPVTEYYLRATVLSPTFLDALKKSFSLSKARDHSEFGFMIFRDGASNSTHVTKPTGSSKPSEHIIGEAEIGVSISLDIVDHVRTLRKRFTGFELIGRFHIHPPDSYLFPSGGDLDVSFRDFYETARFENTRRFPTVDLIGMNNGKQASILAYQITNKVLSSYFGGERLVEFLAQLEESKVKYRFQDEKVSEKFAKIIGDINRRIGEVTDDLIDEFEQDKSNPEFKKRVLKLLEENGIKAMYFTLDAGGNVSPKDAKAFAHKFAPES
jgi:hypothetical protein